MVADPPYRVAYVIGELGKGGAEYQLYELLRHLDRRRFAPGVFVLAPGGWWVEPIRALDRVTDGYLVNCEAIAAWQVERKRLPREKIEVIPNGIDLGRLPPFSLDRRAARSAAGLRRDRRLVAGVGRLDAQKDFPTFLRAAAMIAADFPDVDFLVVGEGEEQAALEAIARRLGLGARVVFTGLRHDVPRLLAAVDVLVLTSLYEGFPNVLLEAMATGAVAVATDVGGCRELVTSGETGLLVPPRAPAAVAAAVGRVLRDPALARRLATAARQRVEGAFSIDVMARRTMDAYLRRLHATRVPAAVAAA